MEGIQTRSYQHQQEMDQKRFGSSERSVPVGNQPTMEFDAGTFGSPQAGAAQPSASRDFLAMMKMLQGQAQEQTCRLEEQMQCNREEDARRQKEQAHCLEEQALIKDLHVSLSSELKGVKEKMDHLESQITVMKNRLERIELQIAYVYYGPVRKDATYEQLREALESQYDDTHLENVFQAQLKDMVQHSSKSIQQWSFQVGKLLQKAYRSASELINGNLV